MTGDVQRNTLNYMDTRHQFTAFLMTATHVASHMPITIARAECTCGWSFESRDVTEPGRQIEWHWRHRNMTCSCGNSELRAHRVS